MGVTGLLLRAGAARPHVLVAAMPGGTAVRLAAGEQLRCRGWPAALTPADADVLLVAGAPAADITAAVEAAWTAVPAPRVRASVNRPGEVATVLDAAQAELATGAPRWLPEGDGAVLPTGHGAGADGSHGTHGMASSHDDMSGGRHGHGMGDMDMGMAAGLCPGSSRRFLSGSKDAISAAVNW